VIKLQADNDSDALDLVKDVFFIPNTFSISRFGEYYLSGVNRHAFENIDSTSLFNKIFKHSFLAENTLNIIIGLDSGLLANYIINLNIPDGTRFLFVELDEIIKFLTIDIPDSHNNKVTVCSQSDFFDLLAEDEYEVYILKNKTILHSSMAVNSGHIEQYVDLFNDIEKELESRASNNAIDFSQKIFTKAQFENVGEMLNSSSMLRSIFVGRSAIVIGGGPSMTEHLAWVKSNRKSLIVIAVSRIANELIRNDIIPDFVVSVDPQDNSFIVNRELMQHYEKTILVYSYHICPRIINQWRGKSLYLGDRLPWHNENNIPTIGPTVSNSSLRLAIEMGCQQVLLSGVDLCYSSTGSTHAKGTIEEKLGPNLGHICEWVDTYAGTKAETPMPLLFAIQSFGSEASYYEGVDLVNLSINAAKINGIRYASVDEVEITGGTLPIKTILDSLPICGDEKSKMTYLTSIIRDVEDKKHDFNHILDKISLVLSLVTKMTSAKNNVKTILSCSKEMAKIEKKINIKFPELVILIKKFGFFEFSRSLAEKDSSEWSQDTINGMHEGYYSAFFNMTKNICELLDSTIERLNSRLSELKFDADFERISSQWIKDNQPGRVLVWQDLFAKKNLTNNNENEGVISSLVSMYKQQLNVAIPSYIERINNIHGVNSGFRKISHLVKTKNVHGLENMITCILPLLGSSKEIDRLYYFASAKRLELEKNFAKALDVMLEMPASLLSENEMKLIIKLSLSTQNLDVAEKFFKKILTITSEYMPQLAHLLRLRGNINASINVYLDYLEQYPDDIVTWLKLGQFMVDVNQVEFAKMAFKNVIEKDSSNKIANDFFNSL
jgi:tetratricopeptide (TPR) repeat protein